MVAYVYHARFVDVDSSIRYLDVHARISYPIALWLSIPRLFGIHTRSKPACRNGGRFVPNSSKPAAVSATSLFKRVRQCATNDDPAGTIRLF